MCAHAGACFLVFHVSGGAAPGASGGALDTIDRLRALARLTSQGCVLPTWGGRPILNNYHGTSGCGMRFRAGRFPLY